jgi:solute carrier family 30 (zinc transporter), member 9
MPISKEQSCIKTLENDPMVSGVYDVKSTMLGDVARFKAEVLFNGEAITSRYLDSLSPEIWEYEMEKLKQCKNSTDMQKWVVRHGGGIVEVVGGEVDRLEWEIKKAVPEVKHIDLEIL